MKKFGRLFSVACAAACLVPFAACGGGVGGKDVVASYIRCNADGTETFMVDGEPFLYLGTEARFEAYVNCDKASYDDYEKYVKAAADLGFNVLAVSVDWEDIEPQKDVYDFTVINKILGFALKYDIKIELLWYSALMCGDTHEWHLPDYIYENTPRYQMYINGVEQPIISNSTLYGEQFFMRIDDKEFMSRETKAVEAVMQHIYEWEEARSFPKVLIGVQVYNEVDAFPEKRLEQYNVSLNGKRLTKDEVWDTICTAMNNCAKAFKSSPYKVITRTNLLRPECADLQASGFSPISRAQQLYNLKYLDAVGYDPYYNNLTELKKTIEFYQKNLPKNFTHVAENGRLGTKGEGAYENGEGELLLAISKNCGYILYELCSPKLFNEGGYSQGIIDSYTLEDFSYTDKIRQMCKALQKVGGVAASANPADFAVFNLDTSSGWTVWNKTVNTTGVTFNFNTASGAKGFAIEQDGYVYAYANDAAELTLSHGTFGGAETGAFVNGVWVKDADAEMTGNKITLGGGVYRIKITSSEGKQESTTDTFKG